MQYLIVGSLVAVLTAIATVKAKALTLTASLEAAVMILCSCLFGGWFGLVFLLSAYLTIALVDRILKKPATQILGNINKKHGPRDVIQVAANGLPATVCIVAYGLTKNQGFLLGFAVALTEALADSMASDVGILSKKDPFSICRFRPVPKGLSGGVSLVGTLASFGATVLCAGLYVLFFRELKGAVGILIFGNLGCLIDSVLGDLLQEKFKCPQCGCLTEKPRHCQEPTARVSGIPHFDNCLVNLVSNALSAVFAVLAFIW